MQRTRIDRQRRSKHVQSEGECRERRRTAEEEEIERCWRVIDWLAMEGSSVIGWQWGGGGENISIKSTAKNAMMVNAINHGVSVTKAAMVLTWRTWA